MIAGGSLFLSHENVGVTRDHSAILAFSWHFMKCTVVLVGGLAKIEWGSMT